MCVSLCVFCFVFISSFYKEAVENAAHYNSQLFQNKKLRLPYLDAQTGIAQTTSPLLRSRLERRRGALHGQIFSYPPRRWRKEPPPLPKVRPGVCVCVCVLTTIRNIGLVSFSGHFEVQGSVECGPSHYSYFG